MPTRNLRQPAEWEPHQSCWLAWPSHENLWGDALAEVRQRFVSLCEAILDPHPAGAPRGEALDILVLDEQGEGEVRRALPWPEMVRTHRASFGDVWLRDTAPVFVERDDGEPHAVTFHFNGWGGKYLLPGDSELSEHVSRLAGVPMRRLPIMAEGGALETDGEGTCITTRECLLNPNRNPGMSEQEVERIIREGFGFERVLWLERGLMNDHTDGHVDNLARFVAPGRVVCMTPGPSDPNLEVLDEIRERLESERDAAGRPLEVVTIPAPGRVLDGDGKLMPASYMNFFIANRSVIVPLYETDKDEEALATLERCFPDRNVIGLNSRALLGGGGAFHCITQQVPRARALGAV